MGRQIETADFVLMVMTKTYCERFQHSVGGRAGKGVKFEGLVITQAIYEQNSENDRFIPVAVLPRDFDAMPLWLKSTTHYDLGDAEQVRDLRHRVSSEELPSARVPPVRSWGEATRYPLLSQDVAESTAVLMSEDTYLFRVFSVGERGMEVSRDLQAEVVDGLVSQLTAVERPFDYLLSIDPGGLSWAHLVLAAVPSIPRVCAIRNWQSGVRGQVCVPQESGFYAGRTLWFPRMKPGDRVAILDDVISTGETLRLVVKTLREHGVVPVAALCIIRKKSGSGSISASLDIDIRSLIEVEG
jgi:adenine phosphoribosyltransferase